MGEFFWTGDHAWVENAGMKVPSVPPAIAGAHGDQHTFKVCCRVVRGFDLDDESAIAALLTWNARCEPPWPEAELRRKILGARQYGREPIGGRLRSIR